MANHGARSANSLVTWFATRLLNRATLAESGMKAFPSNTLAHSVGIP
jgi:hypothetical protein